jgi:hypothetical protein
LCALFSEQASIERQLAEHRDERARLLREDGQLGAIRALASEDEGLRLRLEQIATQIPDLQAAIEAERLAQWETAWQAQRPQLAEAQERLADAIREFHGAMRHAHATHAAAYAFGGRVTDEFVRPPPLDSYNDWSLLQFVATVARRQHAAQTPPPPPMIELPVLADDTPAWLPRFTPRKVPRDLVEQISPLGWRRVRVLHSVNVTNLNFGHRLLAAGTEMDVPAPAAFAMTYAGVAEYCDETATAPAA